MAQNRANSRNHCTALNSLGRCSIELNPTRHQSRTVKTNGLAIRGKTAHALSETAPLSHANVNIFEFVFFYFPLITKYFFPRFAMRGCKEKVNIDGLAIFTCLDLFPGPKACSAFPRFNLIP